MEPKKQWKVGDLVRLKSGGPVMTVAGYIQPEIRTFDLGEDVTVPYVQCDWFPLTGTAHIGGQPMYAAEACTGEFAADALERAEP